MTYSSALFEDHTPDLTAAQTNKDRRLAEAIDLQPGQRLLEIGCGWGGFAEYAARTYGASVVGLTISKEQRDFAQRRIQEAGLADKVEIRLRDYRDERDRYDRIASIEMIEAVGEQFWPKYFSQLRDRLLPGGLAGIQQDDLDLAAIVRIDRPRRIEHGDAVLRRKRLAARSLAAAGDGIDHGGDEVVVAAAAEEVRGLPYESDDASYVRVAQRDYDDATKIPASFIAELHRHGAAVPREGPPGGSRDVRADVPVPGGDRGPTAKGEAHHDGRPVAVDVEELVPGDVIALAPGDRVPADARLIVADELEVDEAALTGESLPVEKVAHGGTDASRTVLEGSDVTVGTGRALVSAVGGGTRMGATAAAIALEETRTSPLGQKLAEMFRTGLPVIVGGGLLVTVAGVLWGNPLIPQLALGASIAIGAVLCIAVAFCYSELGTLVPSAKTI